jgi:hypothetical protein
MDSLRTCFFKWQIRIITLLASLVGLFIELPELTNVRAELSICPAQCWGLGFHNNFSMLSLSARQKPNWEDAKIFDTVRRQQASDHALTKGNRNPEMRDQPEGKIISWALPVVSVLSLWFHTLNSSPFDNSTAEALLYPFHKWENLKLREVTCPRPITGAVVWIWVECPPRLHVLNCNPHCQVLRGWRLHLTMVWRGGAFGECLGSDKVITQLPLLNPREYIRRGREALCWWLTPIILAVCDWEDGGLKLVHEYSSWDRISKITREKWMWLKQ